MNAAEADRYVYQLLMYLPCIAFALSLLPLTSSWLMVDFYVLRCRNYLSKVRVDRLIGA